MAKRKRSKRANSSGQIVRDGNAYRIRLQVGTDPRTGRPKYKTARCPSHKEATEALNRMIRDSGNGRLESTGKDTLGSFLDRWLANVVKPSKAPNTYRQYAWLVEDHIKPHLGTKPIGKVKRSDVQALLALKATQEVASRSKEGAKAEEPANGNVAQKEENSEPVRTLGTNTLRLVRAILHAAFEDAIKDGRAAQNPASRVDLPAGTTRSRARWLTPEEGSKLLAECSAETELANLFAFMLYTGTRIGEATGVRWQDLDLGTNPTVRITGQLQRQGGELGYRSTTKTNQVRTLPVMNNLAERLRALKGARLLSDGQDPDGIVFLNSYGRRIDQKYANVALADLCRKAGVPVVSAHGLRHTAATILLAETGDLHATQKYLGHSQVALTANLYGHANAETLRPFAMALNKLERRGA